MSMPPDSPLFRRLGQYYSRPFAWCGIVYIIIPFLLLLAACVLLGRFVFQ